jgi:GTP-binding protein
VERILSMVDGVILLVDAAEGPMPQTKFVTGKALALGLKPIVVVNKIDRPDARPAEVLDECFELFLSLDANDEQLDFPTLYASGRNGYAGLTDDVRSGDLTPMFEKIVEHVPAPGLDPDGEFAMLTTLLDRDNFLGRILTGRIESGRLKVNMPIKAIDVDGKVVEEGRATKVFAFRGLERVPVEEAQAGRHRRDRRPHKGDRLQHHRRAGPHRADRRPPDRPADAGDELRRQRQPLCGPRRRQGAEPSHPRPA